MASIIVTETVRAAVSDFGQVGVQSDSPPGANIRQNLRRAGGAVEAAQRLATADHLTPAAPAVSASTDALDRLDAALYLAGLEIEAANAAREDARLPHVLRALASLETAAGQLSGVQSRRSPGASESTDALDQVTASVEGACAVLSKALDELLELTE